MPLGEVVHIAVIRKVRMDSIPGATDCRIVDASATWGVVVAGAHRGKSSERLLGFYVDHEQGVQAGQHVCYRYDADG